jgi:hypothetical protein
MGGSTRQTQDSTQQTILPGNQQANVDLLMQGAGELYRSGGPQYFSGQNYTTPTANQQAGRQQVVNYAQGAGQNMVNEAQAANSFWMNPNNVYNLAAVPGYSGVRQGIQDDVTKALMEQWLPANRGTAIQGGALGGSRGLQMDALAKGRAAGELGKELSNLDFQTSGRNLQAAQQALDRSGQMFSLGMQPGRALDTVGSAERGDSVEKLQADMARWDFDQNKQGRLLALLQALTGTANQYGGTVKTHTTTQQNSDPTGQILGAALMAGSMFLPGAAPALAAAGTAGGSSNFGAMSDLM